MNLHPAIQRYGFFLFLLFMTFTGPSIIAQNGDGKGAQGSNPDGILSDTPFYIETFEVANKEKIRINTFYFVNHFFIHVLNNFGLLNRMSAEDVEYTVEELLASLYSKEPVNFVFNNYKNNKKLAVSLSIVSKEKNNYLLLLTNYDSKIKDVLPLDTPRGKRADCFSTIYLITPAKLVNESHFFSEEVESELKKAGMLLNLADFYLFDEKSDNDSQIEEMLTRVYKSTKKPEDKFQAAILLGLYYLMMGKTDLGLNAFENAKTLVEKDVKENKKALAKALDIQFQELRIIKKLKDKGFE